MQVAKSKPGAKVNVIEKDRGAYLVPFDDSEDEVFSENDRPDSESKKTYL